MRLSVVHIQVQPSLIGDSDCIGKLRGVIVALSLNATACDGVTTVIIMIIKLEKQSFRVVQ